MDKSWKKINFEQAKELMDSEPEHLIVDVREEDEYITGHADGAVLFPVDSINAETAQEIAPDKDTPLLIYCRSGRRSAIAAKKFTEMGYTRVYDLGSLVGWPYGMAW
jgi:rhodanese-related sulfurtransferase